MIGEVLVTGGAGYIGKHVCVELLEAGYSPVIVDNFSTTSRCSLRELNQVLGKPLKVFECDIRNYSELRTVFECCQLNSVIHCAGLKSVSESGHMPLTYFDNNVAGTITLLRLLEEFRCKRLVFSSSATVYGNPSKTPIREDHPINPQSVYGVTKAQIESLLKAVCASDKSWQVISLRYFNPVGAHGTLPIGEEPSGHPNNLMPYICDVALGKRSALSIFGSDYPTRDGTGVRDYIHVRDLARGHIDALVYSDAHVGYRAFNLGTGDGYSVLDVVNTFMETCKVDIKYSFCERRSGDVATSIADPARANTEMGWKSRLGLEEMCKSAWDFAAWKERGIK